MSVSSVNGFFSLAADHLELCSRGVSELIVDPVKSAVYYVFPFLAAYFGNYHELRADPSLEAMMPPQQTEGMLREIRDLTSAAGIGRDVVPYIALNHTFNHSGGFFSLTKPALFIPEQHLFRRNGLSPFPRGENVSESRWIFSNDETRFLIARELGQIKECNALLRIAIKVGLIAAIFIFYTSPVGLVGGAALLTASIGLYIFSEKRFQARADLLGVEILRGRVENPKDVAIAALEKMRWQNLYRRENSALARLYITESGNNVLDFMHPFLTTRINNLCEGNS